MTKKKKYLTVFAKELRNNLTDAEKLLWYFLRRKQFEKLKFRRQVPIGSYIVDFICLSKKIIIELDGSQHLEYKNIIKDKKRDEWLSKEGFAVLRFWDNEVLQNIDGVLEKILEHFDTLP